MDDIEIMKKPYISSEKFYNIINEQMENMRGLYSIFAGLELGIFELLKNPLKPKEISKKLNCNENLITLLCNALYDIGLLDKKAEKYVNNEIANIYLIKDSHFTQINYMNSMKQNINLWSNLSEIIKNGPVKVKNDIFFGDIMIDSMAENSICGMLQETVYKVMEVVDFSNVRKLLDIGGGHGLYAIAFASLNKQLKAFVFDYPYVIEKTKKYIQKYNANRVELILGDFYRDDLGNDYDVIFSSFNPSGCNTYLIPKIASALNKNGIYINKQSFNKGEYTPLENLEWNLWTFNGMKKGFKKYSYKNNVSEKEYINALKNNNFKILNIVDMDNNSSTMIIAKKL